MGCRISTKKRYGGDGVEVRKASTAAVAASVKEGASDTAPLLAALQAPPDAEACDKQPSQNVGAQKVAEASAGTTAKPTADAEAPTAGGGSTSSTAERVPAQEPACEKEEASSSTPAAADVQESGVDAEAIILEEVPEEVLDSWEALIERGEVRTDLSWHEAAAAGELKTLQWLKSARELRELLDLKNTEKLTAVHVAARAGELAVCEWLLKCEADIAAQAQGRSVPLHFAASEGHLTVCQLLLEPTQLWSDQQACPLKDWPHVATFDLWRRGPLHKAADGGHLEVVELLLKTKASVDKADREGDTPLHKAASAGHAQVIEAILRNAGSRAPLDFSNSEGCSPLDLCVKHRHCRAGDILVQAGAKLVKDARKKPPSLLDAVTAELPFLCTYILKGAPNVGSNSRKTRLAELDESGRTAMLLAAASGSLLVVQRLLEGRADPETAASVSSGGALGAKVSAGPFIGRRPIHTAADAGHQEVLAFLVEQRATLDALDAAGQTAIFYAAKSGHTKLCQWLLGNKLGPKTEDNTEQTPLHLAAANGHVAACEVLLQGASGEEELAQLVTAADWECFEPVHLAVREGHPQVCRFLAERKANLHAALDFGVTTLQLAADHGHVEVLQLLLADLAGQEGSSPADPAGGCSAAVQEAVSASRSDGRNAWLLCAARGHLECCKQVWEAAGSPAVAEGADRDGRTAMLLAARNGHVTVCAWLSDLGADVRGLTVTDTCGWTPLHVASAEGKKEVVRWLLDARADVGATDEDGKTAREWAALRGHLAVEARLRDAEKAVAAVSVGAG